MVDGTEQTYDGQGYLGQNQGYDNSEEQEEKTRVELEYEENQYHEKDYDSNTEQGGALVELEYENKPYEENYEGDDGLQSNEVNYNEPSYNQRTEADDLYNTSY